MQRLTPSEQAALDALREAGFHVDITDKGGGLFMVEATRPGKRHIEQGRNLLAQLKATAKALDIEIDGQDTP